jgi:hypothetical protein
MTMRLTLITLISVSFAVAQAPPPAAPPKPQRVQPPARINEFRAQPSTIQPGQSATLIWASENPNASTISPEIGKVTPRGSRQVSPKATTTYVLTVTGPNNTVLTREVTVTIPGTTPVVATATSDAKKDVPRLANGKPDLSGVYSFGGGGAPGGGRGAAAPSGPELKPGMEKYRVVRGPNDAGALSDCMPIAGPAAFTVPYQFQIQQTPSYTIILHEYPGVFRIIPTNSPTNSPTNGAAHPVDPDPTWMGDSVGRWDGDTLVVDTVGFNTRTELSGFNHSEALHIVERFSRPEFDTLRYDATLEDPNVFVRPWTVSRTFPLRPDLNKIDEFVCENNKDYSKLFVKQ